jgi:hypothetical protein
MTGMTSREVQARLCAPFRQQEGAPHPYAFLTTDATDGASRSFLSPGADADDEALLPSVVRASRILYRAFVDYSRRNLRGRGKRELAAIAGEWWRSVEDDDERIALLLWASSFLHALAGNICDFWQEAQPGPQRSSLVVMAYLAAGTRSEQTRPRTATLLEVYGRDAAFLDACQRADALLPPTLQSYVVNASVSY